MTPINESRLTPELSEALRVIATLSLSLSQSDEWIREAVATNKIPARYSPTLMANQGAQEMTVRFIARMRVARGG